MAFEHIKTKYSVCRKPHRCIWCGAQTEAGEEAVYRAYKINGDFVDDYMHPECYDAMNDSTQDMDNDEFLPYEALRGKTIAETEEIQLKQRS